MSSVSYLPSDISKLVYGYLRSECSKDLADKFLNTCASMRECRAHKDIGFDSNFQGQFSLTQILNQYSALSELVFKNLMSKDMKCTHVNIVPLLQKLLHSRVGYLAETSRPPTCKTQPIPPADENDAEIVIKASENVVTNTAEGVESGARNCDRSRSPTNETVLTPAKVDDTATTFQKPSPRKSNCVEKSLIWDHSVQNILARYSPRTTDRGLNVQNGDECTPKKRKFGDIEGEITNTPKESSVRTKRRKSTPPRLNISNIALERIIRSS